jgi:hypothetical protein
MINGGAVVAPVMVSGMVTGMMSAMVSTVMASGMATKMLRASLFSPAESDTHKGRERRGGDEALPSPSSSTHRNVLLDWRFVRPRSAARSSVYGLRL